MYSSQLDLRQRLQALQAGGANRLSPASATGTLTPSFPTLMHMFSATASTTYVDSIRPPSRLEERLTMVEDLLVQQEQEKQELLRALHSQMDIVRPTPQRLPCPQTLPQEDISQQLTPYECDDYDEYVPGQKRSMPTVYKPHKALKTHELMQRTLKSDAHENRPRGRNPGYVTPTGKMDVSSQWDDTFEYQHGESICYGAYVCTAQTEVGQPKRKIYRPKHSDRWYYVGTQKEVPKYAKKKQQATSQELAIEDEVFDYDALLQEEALTPTIKTPTMKPPPIVWKFVHKDRPGYTKEHPFTERQMFKPKWDATYLLNDSKNTMAPQAYGAWVATVNLTKNYDEFDKRPFQLYAFKPWTFTDALEYEYESKGEYIWKHVTKTTIKYHGVAASQDEEFLNPYPDHDWL